MGRVRAAAAASGSVASAGVSPASGGGPVVLPGDPDPARDGHVVGRYRSDPRTPSVGHDARACRDEWIAAGVFERLKTEATACSTGSWASISTMSVWMVHCTRRPMEVREPARTPLIVPSWAGNGLASERHGVPIGWVIDDANRNDVRMLVPTIDAVADAGLLADIDTLHLDRGYDYPVGREHLAALVCTTSTCNAEAPRSPARNDQSGWDCAGSSRPPTRGGRTTASFAATPTAAAATGTPRSASPPRSSSSASSSITATAGAPDEHLSAQVLSANERFTEGYTERFTRIYPSGASACSVPVTCGLVRPLGFEPRTCGLRVRSRTSQESTPVLSPALSVSALVSAVASSRTSSQDLSTRLSTRSSRPVERRDVRQGVGDTTRPAASNPQVEGARAVRRAPRRQRGRCSGRSSIARRVSGRTPAGRGSSPGRRRSEVIASTRAHRTVPLMQVQGKHSRHCSRRCRLVPSPCQVHPVPATVGSVCEFVCLGTPGHPPDSAPGSRLEEEIAVFSPEACPRDGKGPPSAVGEDMANRFRATSTTAVGPGRGGG